MINDLNLAQRELAEYMSYLSEEAYCTSWMDDLEFKLWQVMNGEITEYGRLEITSQIITKLKDLSSIAKGWIIFDDDLDELYLTWELWQGYLNKNKSKFK